MLVIVGRRHAENFPSGNLALNVAAASLAGKVGRVGRLYRPAGSRATALGEVRRAGGSWALGAVIEFARTSR
jgi:hypothetical protein